MSPAGVTDGRRFGACTQFMSYNGSNSRLLGVVAMATATVGAFLVFSIQPVAGRVILPIVGGHPVAWLIISIFFQILLLIGYIYAGLILDRRGGATIHLVALLLAAAYALVAVPVGLQRDRLPSGLGSVLLQLGVLLAPSVVLAASTVPLLHGFLRHKFSSDSQSRFLYAMSNVGSLSALVAYPFVIEPNLRLPVQTFAWSMVFVVFAVMSAALSWFGRGRAIEQRATLISLRERTAIAARCGSVTFIATALMLSVTSSLAIDMPAIPLLWIGPMVGYLAAFVLAYRLSIGAGNLIMEVGLIGALYALFLILGQSPAPSVSIHFTTQIVLLFLVTCALLVPVARDVPQTRNASHYYGGLAVGGILGAFAVVVVAPTITNPAAILMRSGLVSKVLMPLLTFSPIPELGWLLALAAVAIVWQRPTQSRISKRGVIVGTIAVALCALSGPLVDNFIRSRHFSGWLALLALALPLLLAYGLTFARAGARFLFAGALLLGLAVAVYRHDAPGLIDFRERSIFGVLKVSHTSDQSFLTLHNGSTLHGIQTAAPSATGHPVPVNPEVALSYYSTQGPLGDVMRNFSQQKHLAVIGLGIGSVAAYANRNDSVSFFDIDPAVISLAQDERYFSYISGARARGAKIDLVNIDGRLGLDQTEKSFDAIIVDAFSSDAIPIHLLTTEALAVMENRLTENGILIFHVSNRYLDLRPVLGAAAAHLGWSAQARENLQGPFAPGQKPSSWVALSPHSQTRLLAVGWHEVAVPSAFRYWTDDYASVWSILKNK